MINFLVVDKIIKDALVEDIPHEDISTNSVINKDCISTIDLICKEEGIIAGLEVFKRVFDILGDVFQICRIFVVQHFSFAVNISKKLQKHPDLLEIGVFSWWRLLDSNQ